MSKNVAAAASGASWAASISGVAVGHWLADHWLQIFSAFFILMTYITQLVFSRRRDKRELERHVAAMREDLEQTTAEIREKLDK